MQNDIDIAGLRELEKKATNANWASPKASEDGTCQVYATHDGPLRRCVPVANTMKHDGDFIVALRNAASELFALAEIGNEAESLREFLKADPKFDRLVQLIDKRKDG